MALRLGIGLLRGLRPGLRLVGDAAQARLQVVEDESGRRLRAGRGRDRALPLADEEDTALAASRPPAVRPAGRRRRGPPPRPAPVRSAASSLALCSSSVDATGEPSPSTTIAEVICADSAVNSDSACAASIGGTRYHHASARDLHQVLCRPGHAPRGDDRLLRAALVRPAPLPRARAARVVGPRGRVELFRHRAPEDLPRRLDLEHRRRDPHDSAQRDLDRDPRRRLPALVVALLLQRPRVGVQHRLWPAEPRLPAREGPGGRVHAHLARRAVRRPCRRRGRRASAQPLRPRVPRQPIVATSCR